MRIFFNVGVAVITQLLSNKTVDAYVFVSSTPSSMKQLASSRAL